MAEPGTWNRATWLQTLAAVGAATRACKILQRRFSRRRTSSLSEPWGGPTQLGLGGARWDIRHFARATPELDAKLALELCCFLQRIVVIASDDGVYCNREPVRTDYKGQVRITLSFLGSVAFSRSAQKPS
jgi:hypothetical protein